MKFDQEVAAHPILYVAVEGFGSLVGGAIGVGAGGRRFVEPLREFLDEGFETGDACVRARPVGGEGGAVQDTVSAQGGHRVFAFRIAGVAVAGFLAATWPGS